jgi:hypothetical protein
MNDERKEIWERIERNSHQITELLIRQSSVPVGGTTQVSEFFPGGETKQIELNAQQIRHRLDKLRRQQRILNFASGHLDSIRAGLSVEGTHDSSIINSDRRVTSHDIDRFIDYCERHINDFENAVAADAHNMDSDIDSDDERDADLFFNFTDEVEQSEHDAANTETKVTVQLYRY